MIGSRLRLGFVRHHAAVRVVFTLEKLHRIFSVTQFCFSAARDTEAGGLVFVVNGQRRSSIRTMAPPAGGLCQSHPTLYAQASSIMGQCIGTAAKCLFLREWALLISSCDLRKRGSPHRKTSRALPRTYRTWFPSCGLDSRCRSSLAICHSDCHKLQTPTTARARARAHTGPRRCRSGPRDWPAPGAEESDGPRGRRRRVATARCPHRGAIRPLPHRLGGEGAEPPPRRAARLSTSRTACRSRGGARWRGR